MYSDKLAKRLESIVKKAKSSNNLLTYTTLNEAESVGEDLNRYSQEDLCSMLLGSALQICKRVWYETDYSTEIWEKYLTKFLQNCGIIDETKIKTCVKIVLEKLKDIFANSGMDLK